MPLPALDAQQARAARPLDGARIFLEGPAGAGKSTAAAGRLVALLASGAPADSILILVPQRTLARPYYDALRDPAVPGGGAVSLLTLGGLAQRMVELFWPLAAERACFAHPEHPPVFLTIETAQYYMARLVAPLRDERGYFESTVIGPNRLYGQLLDNLNKAAVNGFDHTEIGARLGGAWTGESARRRVFDEVQECAARFREYCLAHNLLDFSLQYEVFIRHLWPQPLPRRYLLDRYRHLIVDNVEEDTAAAHDVLREWLPETTSALLVYDHDAGFRRFLGADPGSAATLRDLCSQRLALTRSRVNTPALRTLERSLASALGVSALGVSAHSAPPVRATARAEEHLDLPQVLAYKYHRYYPEMTDWTAEEIAALVKGGAAPAEIAVLAPFLNDSLRFLLAWRLKQHGIAARSHRPSRALRDEPAVRCLLTLAALAHPDWNIEPPRPDVAQALVDAIDELDPVRARLLAEALYRPRDGRPALLPFDRVEAAMQERITYTMGRRYERLREWLAAYATGAPAELHHFFSRLFGELLTQPGFRFHVSLDAGAITAALIESARKFRTVAGDGADPQAAGREYLRTVAGGVLAAEYTPAWRPGPEDAVLLAPAYTFLMSNRPVDYQFWLDAGSSGWWERLAQPLTHPYVLARSWPPGKLWTDADEYEARQGALYDLLAGLIRRCRVKVYLGLNQLGAEGGAQQGPLLRAVQQILRQAGRHP